MGVDIFIGLLIKVRLRLRCLCHLAHSRLYLKKKKKQLCKTFVGHKIGRYSSSYSLLCLFVCPFVCKRYIRKLGRIKKNIDVSKKNVCTQ